MTHRAALAVPLECRLESVAAVCCGTAAAAAKEWHGLQSVRLREVSLWLTSPSHSWSFAGGAALVVTISQS